MRMACKAQEREMNDRKDDKFMKEEGQEPMDAKV